VQETLNITILNVDFLTTLNQSIVSLYICLIMILL